MGNRWHRRQSHHLRPFHQYRNRGDDDRCRPECHKAVGTSRPAGYPQGTYRESGCRDQLSVHGPGLARTRPCFFRWPTRWRHQPQPWITDATECRFMATSGSQDHAAGMSAVPPAADIGARKSACGPAGWYGPFFVRGGANGARTSSPGNTRNGPEPAGIRRPARIVRLC